MQESVETAKGNASAGARGVALERMAIPAILPKAKNIYASAPTIVLSSAGAGADEESAGNEEEETEEAVGLPKAKVMPFKLLSRDLKGRVEARQLLVPKESGMVARLLKQEEAQRQEKQRIKEKTLEFDRMSEGLGGAGTGAVSGTGFIRTSNSVGGTSIVHQQLRGPSSGSGGAGYGTYGRGRHGSMPIRLQESHRAADTLDLDDFLAISSNAVTPPASSTAPSAPALSGGRSGASGYGREILMSGRGRGRGSDGR